MTMKNLKSLVLGLLLTLTAPLAAFAQCSGQAPAATYCGNPAGSTVLPRWQPMGGFVVDLDVGSTTITGGGTGRLLYDNAGVLGEVATTATSRQMLQSGASSVPVWSTATWPATTSVSQILYSSAPNTVAGLATANNGVLVTDGTGVPSISSTLPVAVLTGLAQSVSNLAAIKTIAVSANTRVFVASYATDGDGGGGWFYGDTASAAADNACTVVAPNSGTGRWLRAYEGQTINVKWCGVLGTGATESLTQLNIARDLAIAQTGCMYFPSTTQRYVLPTAGLVIPDNTHGLCIEGDARSGESPGTVGTGTTIVTSGPTVISMVGVSLGGTGSISEISLKNLNLFSSGASGPALKVWNVNDFAMTNVLINASNGIAFDMSGTANFNFRDVYSYAGGAFTPTRFANDAVGAQSNGPGVWNGGQMSITNGSAPSLTLIGDPLGIVFQGIQFSWVNSTGGAVIDIDGPSVGSPYGSTTFLECHSESTYNTTNTGSMFRIGNTNRAGAVTVIGGNYWGHGNGTNYMRDWMQIFDAVHVAAYGATASRLSAVNGFSRSMIRFETNFPTAGLDTFDFRGLVFSGSAPVVYSSATYGIGGANGNKSNLPVNGIDIAQTSSASFTIASGKAVTLSNSLTFTGTDGSTVPFGSATKQVFTTGTGLTYTRPANVKSLRIRMVGGGGGGECGNVVGCAAPAGAGGNTTFGGTLSANGGGGGVQTSVGGAGGTASGGSLNLTGVNGQGAVAIANTAGGHGGVSPFGGAGWGGTPTGWGKAAAANTGSGGGGSGSAGTAQTGSGGGAGGYLEAVITSPAATYTYSVGAGGTAGTGSVNGGAGAAGLIIVDEFYQLMLQLACNDNTLDFCQAM